MVRGSVIICLILMLSGCYYWPPPSKGGYAAHYLFNPRVFRCPGARSICQLHTNRLNHGLCELNALRDQHAAKCYPARYTALRLLGQQIAQEIAVQLDLSVQLNLNLFDANLERLKQLNTLKGCPRIKSDTGWELLKLKIQ
jgi:hypothetical protein